MGDGATVGVGDGVGIGLFIPALILIKLSHRYSNMLGVKKLVGC